MYMNFLVKFYQYYMYANVTFIYTNNNIVLFHILLKYFTNNRIKTDKIKKKGFKLQHTLNSIKLLMFFIFKSVNFEEI